MKDINSISSLTIKERIGTCSKDCYGSCVFVGEWRDTYPEKKFIKAKALKDHPFTKGFFCSKLTKRQELIYHPKRLKNPLYHIGKKGKNEFKTISLNKALNIVAKKITYVINNFGSESILLAFNAGNFGLLSRYAPLRFFGKLNATLTTGGICNEGGCAGLTRLFGTYSTTNPFQIINPNTQLIVVWGSNLSNTNIHAYFMVKQAVKNGAKLIVIDSRRSQIANDSHQFVFINPGTDHLLALIILKRLISLNEIDQVFLKNHVDGYEPVLKEISNFNEKHIISQTGIDSQYLNKLIDYLIEYKHHTIFNVGYGVQKHYFGGRIVQAIALIQILLGNFGSPGTGLIYSQSDFNKRFINPILNYITQISPNSSNPEINLLNLGSALISGNYKILFIYNFNPASSLPNQNILKKVLLKEDLFVVVHEIFLSETTKYADIVIPSKFDLETNDLIAPYYIPGLSFNQAGPCPYPNCLSNFEFYKRLAWKIGWKDDPLFQENEELIVQKSLELLPSNMKNDMKKNGYHVVFKPNDVTFGDLIFPTSNGRIQLQGPHFKFGKSEFQALLTRERNTFLLITPSHKSFIHSQLGQIQSKYLVDFNKVYINPSDIKNHNLLVGEEVLISNDFGSEKYIVEESASLREGVALIYSGCPMDCTRNVNNLISDKPEELGFSGVYNSALISITKLSSRSD